MLATGGHTSVLLPQVIKTNSSDLHKHHLLTPRIARYVRLVIDDGVGDKWCLKMEIHGCPWTKHGKQSGRRNTSDIDVCEN